LQIDDKPNRSSFDNRERKGVYVTMELTDNYSNYAITW